MRRWLLAAFTWSHLNAKKRTNPATPAAFLSETKSCSHRTTWTNLCKWPAQLCASAREEECLRYLRLLGRLLSFVRVRLLAKGSNSNELKLGCLPLPHPKPKIYPACVRSHAGAAVAYHSASGEREPRCLALHKKTRRVLLSSVFERANAFTRRSQEDQVTPWNTMRLQLCLEAFSFFFESICELFHLKQQRTRQMQGQVVVCHANLLEPIQHGPARSSTCSSEDSPNVMLLPTPAPCTSALLLGQKQQEQLGAAYKDYSLQADPTFVCST